MVGQTAEESGFENISVLSSYMEKITLPASMAQARRKPGLLGGNRCAVRVQRAIEPFVRSGRRSAVVRAG